MTVSNTAEEMMAGPSTSQMCAGVTTKFGKEYFDEKLFYAPIKEDALKRIQLCKTKIPVADSTMSLLPPLEKRPPVETPIS